ncbi:MAG: ATP-binding protein [Chloroflexota bacterium]|nr:ATP-binding protein [Chloroflexota bacterium]
MNLSYLLPPFLASVINVILLVMVLRRDYRSFVHRILSLLLFSAALWGISIFAMRISPDTEHALIWERVAIPFIFATSVLYYHFCLVYTRAEKKRNFIPAAYIFLAIAVAFSSANLLISHMELRDYVYTPVFNPSAYPFFLCGFFLMLLGLYNLIKAFRASRVYEDRNRLFYIILASIFPLLGSAIDIFPHAYPAGIFGNIIFCILVTVAILKYHLLDIHIAIRKGAVYLLVSALVAVPLVGIILIVTHVLHEQFPSWGYIILLIVIAFVLQPVWRKVQDWVERRFYHGRYEYIKKLEEFSKGAAGLTELKELASPLLNTLAPALETDKAYLLLPSLPRNLTMVASSELSYHGSSLSIAMDSPFIQFMKHHQGFLNRYDFDIIPQLQALSSREKNVLFQEIEGELFIPLKTKTEFIGLLILGQKSNRQPYSGDDLQILSSTLPQLTTIMDNARLYDAEKRHSKEVTLLNELGTIVTSELDINKVYQVLINELRIVLHIDYASIDLIEPEKERLFCVATSSQIQSAWNPGESIPLQGTATAWVSSHKRLHYEVDLAKKREFWTDEKLLERGVRSIVRLPLYTKETVIGTFILGSQEPDAYTEDDLGLLQQVANQIAIATENSQLYDKEKTARLEIERHLRERTEFINSLVHEIKTPLTPIIASSDLLMEELSADPASPFYALAKNLNSGARSLNLRISELTDFAKMQSTRLVVNPQPIYIQQLIQVIANQMSPLLQSEGQNLNLELSDSLPQAKADLERMEQVLLNLLTNASKFSPRNTSISIRAYQKDDYLAVEVIDSAPPINPKEAKLIFTPYYRTKQTKRIHGLGIGLAICKNLVELQGGKIWVESQDKGNCFIFTLPLARSQQKK